jgi:Mg-chelatase subunit ChlD
MKRYKGYQFKQAVESLIEKIAGEFGVKVNFIEWSNNITTAGINTHGRIYLCDVADEAELFDIDVQRYVGFAVHELLHRKYTDFSVNGDTDYLKQLHNACEDAWIEHTGIEDKLTGNIEGLLTALSGQMADKAVAQVTDWADPRQYPYVFACHLRKHGKPVPVAQDLEPIIDQAKVMIDNCQSSADTLDVAKWIMSQLMGLPENPSSIESQTVGKARRPPRDCEPVDVEPTNDAPDGKGGIGCWDENASITKINAHLKDDWIKHQPTIPARLRYEVKRLFDNSGMEEFQRNRRAGSINSSALHKIGMTDKLFQRRHETEGIDSAVVICLDVSGSMFSDGGKKLGYDYADRIVYAVLTARALIETLQKSQVATCVLTFGTRTAVLKPFGMNPVKAVPMFNSIDDGGGTNDYFCLRYAHKLLLNRPEQRKIAMVITDGQGWVHQLRRQVASGEKLGITTIGIGIQENVSNVYKQAINIKKAEDLGVVSFKQIKLAV